MNQCSEELQGWWPSREENAKKEAEREEKLKERIEKVGLAENPDAVYSVHVQPGTPGPRPLCWVFVVRRRSDLLMIATSVWCHTKGGAVQKAVEYCENSNGSACYSGAIDRLMERSWKQDVRESIRFRMEGV